MKFDFNKSRFEFIESYHKDYDSLLLIDIYDSVTEWQKIVYDNAYYDGYQEGLLNSNPVEIEQEEVFEFDDDQDLTLLSYNQLYSFRHRRLENKLDYDDFPAINKFALEVEKEYRGYLQQYLERFK